MDGFAHGLSYTGQQERIEHAPTRIQTATYFWEIIMMQLSYGSIPDGFPFNPEGSELLIRGEH